MIPEVLPLFEEGNFAEIAAPVIFRPGKASQTERFKRYTSAGEKSIFRKHSSIVDQLEVFLGPAYSILAGNMSVEMTRFHGNIADIVTRDPKGAFAIYEVKTHIKARKNIREAIAQLLDYAAHGGDMVIRSLIIVSPAALSPSDSQFLEKLKSVIEYPVSYLQYIESADGGNGQFILC